MQTQTRCATCPAQPRSKKPRSKAQLFGRFCALGTRRGFLPARENRSPALGLHPERTACVRGSNADTNTVRVLPTAGAGFLPAQENRSRAWACTRNQPRACETGQRNKPGARFAHRRCARRSQGAKLSFSGVSVRYIQPPLSGDLPADRRRPGNRLHGV